jgi:hypothetical protein
MDIAQWECSRFPRQMLEYVQSRTSDRKMRLFACACCRRFWAALPDRRSRHFIETVERYADGLETDSTLDQAYFAAQEVVKETSDPVADALIGLIGVTATYEYQDAMRGVNAERAATFMARCSSEGIAAERLVQAEILRDVLGPLPFQPVPVNPAWLAPTVKDLASTIYSERTFEQMPILGVALEDAGCAHSEILSHCRRQGPHVLGCWVVDLVLGKE